MEGEVSWEEVEIDGHAACEYAEVKGSEVEVWMIRCPPGFDVSTLDGLKMNMASLDAPNCTVGGDGLMLQAVPAHETANHSVAFPDTAGKRWRLSKQFTRQFALVNEVDTTLNSDIQPTEKPPVPQTGFLRLRTSHPGGVHTSPPVVADPTCAAVAGSSAANVVEKKKGKKGERKIASTQPAVLLDQPSVKVEGAAAPLIAGTPMPAAVTLTAEAPSTSATADEMEKKKHKKEKKRKREAEAAAMAAAGQAAEPVSDEAEKKKRKKEEKKRKQEEAAAAAVAGTGEAGAAAEVAMGKAVAGDAVVMDGVEKKRKKEKVDKKEKKEKKAQKHAADDASANGVGTAPAPDGAVVGIATAAVQPLDGASSSGTGESQVERERRKQEKAAKKEKKAKKAREQA